MLFQLKPSDSTFSSFNLQKLSEWNHNYLVTSLVSHNDHLVVGDQISSVSLLQVTSEPKLVTLAKDYGPLWPVAVEAFDDKNIITANVSALPMPRLLLV